MNGKRSASLPVVGASSLLVIFAVLCLTVFALLSISTVRANQRLGDSATAAVSGYYQADCLAEEILARLREGERPEGIRESDGVYSYACAISDTQALAVKVKITDAEYTVLRWQAVSTVDWQADDKILVWNGESE